MRNLLFILSVLLSISSFGQEDTIRVNGFDFQIQTSVVSNDWETKDTLNKLFRMEKGQKTYLLKFYSFKDNGGDCNNLFWLKESFEIKADSIIFTTDYFQKTGIDPIFEERRQIYIVQADGKLKLIYDKYRYIDTDEWVDE
jgi:hypothetical protein